MAKIQKSEDQWRGQLDSHTFKIARMGGTERPFTGKYYAHKETGKYHCVCCGQELFSSVEKYDSGCGWPSFWQPSAEDGVVTLEDRSHGMVRLEVRCSGCDAHLGHVFEDGPKPTGLRYCINSASLDFKKK